MMKPAFTNLFCSLSLALLMLIINEAQPVNAMHGHGMMGMGPPHMMHGMHGMHGFPMHGMHPPHGMMHGPPPAMAAGGGEAGGEAAAAAEKRDISPTSFDQAKMVKRSLVQSTTKLVKRHFGPPGMPGMPPFHMGGGPPHMPMMPPHMGPPPGMGGGGGGGGGGEEAPAEKRDLEPSFSKRQIRCSA
ncbi:uncharacterized protein FA14DRAFT_159313 [Meira miltonrushii]|uniref:Uncharacterized protein n=1 Tax=Meira miltonrushii TaxID=1280837 RepID=A0A316VIN9_9BASI|nr:uncharacterized protein FA14DRAFT_159313 [Meira miltonrushii]PWN37124.1 hypothetical protein FA14DRAFT_159313 [Meira miltonrushii]